MFQKRKIIVLIALGFAIISIVSFAVFYKIKLGGKIWTSKEEEKKSEEKKEVQPLVSVPTPSTLKPESCDKYNGKEEQKNNCLASVAIAINSKDICGLITKEEVKNDCLENILYNEITKGDDEKKCLDLKMEDLKNRCLNDFFWKWDKPEKCAGIDGGNKIKCEDIINNKIAFNSGDLKICENIKGENLKTDCKSTVAKKPKDNDSDGIIDSMEMSYGTNPFKADTDSDELNDYEEISKYLTNPLKADTDGDFFDDGNEVKNGFNPRGKGKL